MPSHIRGQTAELMLMSIDGFAEEVAYKCDLLRVKALCDCFDQHRSAVDRAFRGSDELLELELAS